MALSALARTRELPMVTLHKAAIVGRTQGLHSIDVIPKHRLPSIDGSAPKMTASIAVDLDRGSRQELLWLSRGVVTLGEQFCVSTPLNKTTTPILAPYVDDESSNGAPTL